MKVYQIIELDKHFSTFEKAVKHATTSLANDGADNIDLDEEFTSDSKLYVVGLNSESELLMLTIKEITVD